MAKKTTIKRTTKGSKLVPRGRGVGPAKGRFTTQSGKPYGCGGKKNQ